LLPIFAQREIPPFLPATAHPASLNALDKMPNTNEADPKLAKRDLEKTNVENKGVWAIYALPHPLIEAAKITWQLHAPFSRVPISSTRPQLKCNKTKTKKEK